MRSDEEAGARFDKRVDDVGAKVATAESDNAEGHPGLARRRLVAAIAELDALARNGPAEPRLTKIRARALMELAKSEFETRAGPEPALARLDEMVEAGAARDWRGLVPALAGVRGLLALRAGRHDEALEHLDAAVAAIDLADPVDGCRALLNRGTLHSERRAVGPARADYEECARRAREQGFDLLVFKAEHNLGYVLFRAGQLPRALESMATAARSLPGPPRPTALRDRSEVLLEAGLVGVADETLAEAARIFAAEHLPRDVAECELVRAECALLRGDPQAGRDLAEAARRRFRRRGDESWVVRAALLALQADGAILAAAEPSEQADAAWAALARRAAEVEGLCRRTGRPTWQLTARYLGIEADLARGATADPAAVLDALGPVAGDDPLSVRLYGSRIRALLAMAAGEPARAAFHVRAGQHDLGLHRARFGSLDLRTAGAVHGTALAALDLELSLAEHDPGAALEGFERARAVVGGNPRVTPPSDPHTADLLAQLRRLTEGSRSITARPAADPERVRLFAEAARLKQEILAQSWHESGRGGGPGTERTESAAEVVERLAGRSGAVLLDVLEYRGELVAVRVDGDGARLVRLGESATVSEQVRRVHADLEVLANPLVPDELHTVAQRSLDATLARLDARFVDVLDDPGELVVVAGRWLGVLPWALLASRTGRATLVAPSVHHWMRYAGTAVTSGRVTAAAGPGLRHADEEAVEVAARWPGAKPLLGPDASVAALVDAFRRPGVVHLAAHGRHEPDNPLFSSVRLADGPLFAHELDAGTGDPPELVLLSSCEVGRSSIRAGGEALGLASVLLRTGVACVVAALAPLSDETALRVMSAVHTDLRQGVPVAQAVAAACARVGAETGTAVPLVCLGAPVGV
ncbi:CHAT domain-containing protein [Cellulomonas composti]|uniref:CHAT domain-containing protein n=1 Tax=Cellulomonas composti TaxID=266130 RepID=A0A511JE25_9CELL|nr:CHAT domain-containing protein [Cellulomonas composti]GEL96250.1 CHAT domain-containing protein [Cellulomonas composti]